MSRLIATGEKTIDFDRRRRVHSAQETAIDQGTGHRSGMIDGKEGVLGLLMEGIEGTEVPVRVPVAVASRTCQYLDELLEMCQKSRFSSLKNSIGKTSGALFDLY